MGLNDLMAGNKTVKTKKKPAPKPVAVEPESEEKVTRGIRMKKSTLMLLKKVTNRIEERTGKYTHEDAILEGLTLLAKHKGIEA